MASRVSCAAQYTAPHYIYVCQSVRPKNAFPKARSSISTFFVGACLLLHVRGFTCTFACQQSRIPSVSSDTMPQSGLSRHIKPSEERGRRPEARVEVARVPERHHSLLNNWSSSSRCTCSFMSSACCLCDSAATDLIGR